MESHKEVEEMILMTVEEARQKVRDIFNDPEVCSHEDYAMLLVNMENWVAQQRQLLQDAVDGHYASRRMCEALGIEATLTKFASSLKDQPRMWPGPVVVIAEHGTKRA